ncbi:MAG TPA: hypothetical protein VNY30_01210 [Bryobacteraceae bacterium]|jgi:hypothetical protein|nr:hypothetical protein [Bryobacteraceae bacterium]
MAFQPDILVTSPDEPRVTLVIEAKLHLPDLDRTEAQLKQYMVGMQCPIGMLITPERMWLYRDSYTTRAPDSIQRVGEYNIKSLWREPPPVQETRFEAFVQRRLEDLARTPSLELPSDLRDALEEYILPAITTGDVRAAHPR